MGGKESEISYKKVVDECVGSQEQTDASRS